MDFVVVVSDVLKVNRLSLGVVSPALGLAVVLAVLLDFSSCNTRGN